MRYKVTRTWVVEADNGVDAINLTKGTDHVDVRSRVITDREWLELGGKIDEHTEGVETSP